MFIGTIETLESSHVEYPAAIRQALEYLRAHDFKQMADGAYDVAPGIRANVQRYQTKPVAECRPEAHEKYVDIQYIVEGEEYMGWCPLSPDLEVSEAYDAGKDVGFYAKLVPDSDIVLTPGGFAVLYPEDVHRPKGAVDGEPVQVTKVVVKVPVDQL